MTATTITYHVGDVRDVLAAMPVGSVRSVITSPPYLAKRAYLPADHPNKASEIGQETTPGEFLDVLLGVTDLLWDVVADDGTIWVNLGDTAAGSGGAGGDYNAGGNRDGQAKWKGSGRASWKGIADYPRAKSVCWVPELFGASLAYGRNLLTGDEHRQWITRPPVVWCKPAPTPGEIIDKFREATELIVWASKQGRYYFDLDAVREPPKEDWGHRVINSGAFRGHPNERKGSARPDRACNAKGVPPKTWWVINTSTGVAGPDGAHYATYPIELIERPVLVSCPPGGTILDPFGGSGTTALAAAQAGRDAVLIDIDERNVDLARHRIADAMQIVSETIDGDTWTWTVDPGLPGLKGEHPDQLSIFDEATA